MKNFFNIKNITKIAVLGALAGIINFYSFPLPFFPSFYKLDLSDIPALLGGFSLGPVASVIIEVMKIAINLIFKGGTDTMFIGEAANLIMGCALAVPASVFYARKKDKRRAVIGLAVGVASVCVISAFVNYFMVIPAYVRYMGMSMETIISVSSKANPLIGSLITLIIWATVPFNFIKGAACSVVTFLIYKRLSRILHW